MSLDDKYKEIKISKTNNPIKSDFSYKDFIRHEDLRNFYEKIKEVNSLFDVLFDAKEHKKEPSSVAINRPIPNKRTQTAYMNGKLKINRRLRIKEDFVASSFGAGNNAVISESSGKDSKLSLTNIEPNNPSLLRYKTRRGNILEITEKESLETDQDGKITKKYNLFFNGTPLVEKINSKDKKIVKFNKTFNFNYFTYKDIFFNHVSVEGVDSGLQKVNDENGEDNKTFFEINKIDQRDNIYKYYKITGYRGVAINVDTLG